VFELNQAGHGVNRKRVQRLMRVMGIEALVPRPGTSTAAPGHRIYPYLLRGVSITEPNHVWASDITYIPMALGFLYLVAILLIPTERAEVFDFVAAQDVLPKVLTGYGLVPGVASTSDVSGPWIVRGHIASCISWTAARSTIRSDSLRTPGILRLSRE
jgi:HTH-like domain